MELTSNCSKRFDFEFNRPDPAITVVWTLPWHHLHGCSNVLPQAHDPTRLCRGIYLLDVRWHFHPRQASSILQSQCLEYPARHRSHPHGHHVFNIHDLLQQITEAGRNIYGKWQHIPQNRPSSLPVHPTLHHPYARSHHPHCLAVCRLRNRQPHPLKGGRLVQVELPQHRPPNPQCD